MPSFWLSFCDPELPTGEQFLGCAIIDADNFVCAVRRAHELGINPGGEVAGGDLVPGHPYTTEHKNRLFATREEAERLASLNA